MNEVTPPCSDSPTRQRTRKLDFLKRRRWRVVVLLLVTAISSVFSVFVLEAPMNFYAILFLPAMCVIAPLYGFPVILFACWWTLHRSVPLLVLIVVFFLIAYCSRIWMGTPPEMTDEERNMEEEFDKEAFAEHPGMTMEERETMRTLKEMSERSLNTRNPGYQRKIFPPF